MLRHLYYLLRMAGIGFVVLPALRRKKLAAALEWLGPSYIKLGQVLATRPDIVGTALAADLTTLHDRLPPFPARTARRIVEEERGEPLEGIFASFVEAPAAAASIAQVHRAVLKDGRAVAVKIIRPGVTRAFARDLRLFYWCARKMDKHFPSLRRLKPVEVVRTLEESVVFELDLRYEAAAMTEMQANIAADTGFRIPAVEWRLTSERVLVSEWVDAIPIREIGALLAAGHDLNRILAQLSRHFFLHVFRDGFFHADLHPGNLFVDAAGNIVAVDFGIMGRLGWRERLFIAEIFRGFLQEDYRAVAEAHFRAGYVPPHHCPERFAQAAMAIAKPILGRPAQEVSMARLLGQLFKVAETFDMETQPQLLLLQKTLVVVEGVGRMLNPNVNMWEMAHGPIEEWAQANLGLRGQAKHAAWELRDLVRQWPNVMRKLETLLD